MESMTITDTMNLDALSESVRCAVLTERLPKEMREEGMKVTRTSQLLRTLFKVTIENEELIFSRTSDNYDLAFAECLEYIKEAS